MRVLLVLLYGVAGFGLAIITVSGLSPFGQPIAGIVLPLIVAVDALLRLRNGQAFATAVGAGIAYEAIGGQTPGIACSAFLLSTLAVYALIAVVFAHYSFPAAIASHLAAGLVFGLITLTTAFLSGSGNIDLLSHGGGLLTHTLIGASWTSISRLIRSHVAKTLYVPHHDL